MMGARLRTAIMSITWNALTGLVLAGLLLVPVTCTMVGHPHSLFDTPAGPHAAHAATADHLDHGSHALGTRPPLAHAEPLAAPPVDPGTLVSWRAASDATLVAAGQTVADLPAVTAAGMVMVASNLSALHVTVAALLIAILLATLPARGTVSLSGHGVRVPAPPPRLPVVA